jgi:hypothetical protein
MAIRLPMMYVSRLRRLWIMDRTLLMPGTVSDAVNIQCQLVRHCTEGGIKSCYGLSTPTIRVCMAPSEDRWRANSVRVSRA